MANRKVNITIETTANTSGVNQAAKAMENLSVSSGKASVAGMSAGKNASRFGQLAGQAGFQVQDFAVQTMAGTSALTAFAQQAPQLLGAFGPAGAIAGAVLAVGAIAVKVFMGMGESAEESAKKAEEAFESMLEAFKKAGGKDAEDFINKLETSRGKSDALKESALNLIDVQAKQIKSENDLAKSLSKLDEEALKYLQTTGQIISSEEALIELRNKQDELNKKASIAEIEAGVQSAINRYNQVLQQKEDAEADIKKAEDRINQMQGLGGAQFKATQQLSIAQKTDRFMIEGGHEDKGFVSARTKNAEADLARVQEQIDGLYKFIDQSDNRINQLSIAAFEAAGTVDAVMAQAKISVDQINQEFEINSKAADLKESVTKISAGVKDIERTISEFEPVNKQQEQAKEKILSAVKDGELTAREQVEITGSLQILMGTLKSGQEANLRSLQDLIKINSELTSRVLRSEVQIKDIKSRLTTTPPAR